jgi:hypothetical protein
MQIPGVDWVVAAGLIAEIGVDMSVFVSHYHLAAWARVCPQKSGRAHKGNLHLSAILVGAAISASKTKGVTARTSTTTSRPAAALSAPPSPSPTRSSSPPITCSLRTCPTAILGEAYLDQIGQSRTVANLKRRRERPGYRVTLEPNVQAT